MPRNHPPYTPRLALLLLVSLLAGALALLPGAQPGFAQDDADVVSRVDGEPITREAFHARVRFVRWQYLNELVKLHEATDGNLGLASSFVRQRVADLDDITGLGDAILWQMEEDRLLWQAAEKSGRVPTAEDAVEREAQFFSAWTGIPAADLGASEAGQAFITTWYEEASAVSGLSEDDLRHIFATEALRDVLIELIAENMPLEEPAVRARHILCAFAPEDPAATSPPTAAQRAAAEGCIADAVTRLNAGQDFAAVAGAVSQDAATAPAGGDLGWVLVSYLPEPLAEAVTGAALNTVLGPVETEFGLHLIEVREQRVQPLTDEQLAEGRFGYFEAWAASLRAEAEVTRADDWAEGIPDAPDLDSLPDDVQAAVNRVIAPVD